MQMNKELGYYIQIKQEGRDYGIHLDQGDRFS